MKMKKRFLSILLSLVMVLGLMPGMSLTAYGADTTYSLWVGGTQVTSANATSNDHPTWSYNADTKILTLNGYNNDQNVHTFDSENKKSAAIYTTENLTINLIGTNTVSNPNNSEESKGYAVNVLGNLKISGSGTLNASSGYRCIFAGDYEHSSTLTIDGGTVNVTGSKLDESLGIGTSNGLLTISGGTVSVTDVYNGIDSYSGVLITGGNITTTVKGSAISGGGTGGVTIKGGEVTATGTDGVGISSGSSVTISGGKVTASGGDRRGAVYGYGGVTISAGTVSANGTKIGILTEKGEIAISGGEVTASGGKTGICGWGILDLDTMQNRGGSVAISGGKVTVSGGEKGIDANGGITFDTGMTILAGDNAASAATVTEYEGQKYLMVQTPHTHSFTYSASGATITATCGAAGCGLTSNPTLTIVKPTLTTYGETGKSEAATLDGVADFNTATGLSVADTAIKYYKATKGEGDAYTKGDEITGGAPTDAGDYMAEITLSSVKTGAETTDDVTASVGYTIAKAETTITTAPTAGEITYGQTLANSTLTGGEASVAGSFGWKNTTIAPAVSDSETTEYDVVFTPTDGNYSTAECKVKLTVNKADPTNTVGQLSAFRGQTLADVTLPTAENGVWSWMDDAATTLNELGTSTYFAKFTPNDTNNYKTLENVSVQIVVAEKPMAVPATVTANNRTYDGTEKPLVTAGTATGGEMQYALGTKDAATEPYTTSIPTATDAGTYYIWYKAVAKDDNHVDSTPVCVEVTIGAAQADGGSTAKPLTYDGNAQALVVPGEVIGGKLFYALGSDNVTAPVDGWSETVPTAAEPGTYYVWYKVEGDGNHNSTAPACIVVTIEKKAEATPATPVSTSDFTLLATLKTSGKKALKLSWTAVEGAEGYDIFFGRSSEAAGQYLTSVTGQKYTVKKLLQGIGYRASVQAWRTVNGNKVYIGQPSPDAFAITGGKTAVNFTNPKKISVKKKKMALNVGGTKAIKASVKKAVAGRKYLNKVAKVRYFSSDRRVATVDAKGNITAVGAGACKVFAVAANGLRVGVNVTVK